LRPKEERQNPTGRIHCRDEAILRGTRVLDLTRMLAGPYATRILADFGAEVIKIQSRKSANGAEQNEATSFSAWNRNKRSLTLDLGTPGARDSFLRLAAKSDVVVENFSPRVMENWGLHYERLALVNPGLIMVSISAAGQTGPWRNFVGFAPTFHALSGLISAASGPGQAPDGIEHPYADFIAGLYAALGTLSALEYREKTGKGQHIDLSALEAISTMLGPAFIGSQADSGLTAQPDARIGRGFLPNAEDLVNDSLLAARHFFVTLRHPVLGDVVSTRSALWDWRCKPREWKSSPLLGEHNRLYLESSSP
jgi:crotonobetainyl-CoA:carnitine CoA-transferase CaiB-like acyl-CoA transferase